MYSVTVSPKFEITIPKEICEFLQLQPGQELQLLQYQERLELIVPAEVEKMQGFLKGIDTSFERDEERF